jgi:hypothetical protein
MGNNAAAGAFYFEAARPALVVGATFDSNIVVVCRTLDPGSSVSRARVFICVQPYPLAAASRYAVTGSVAMAVQSMRIPAATVCTTVTVILWHRAGPSSPRDR